MCQQNHTYGTYVIQIILFFIGNDSKDFPLQNLNAQN
jgi:hypothetical protein